MALENNMTPADMAAVMGGNNDGWGNGGIGWLLVLFLFAFMNNGWGGGNNRPGPMPNVATSADVQRGFDQNATQGTLAGIAAQMGNGFADAATARLNGQMSMQQNLFGLQTALQQTMAAGQAQTANGMNAIALGMQQLGSQGQQGIADLKYTVAQENCNDRQALNLGIRDLMAQGSNDTNRIVQAQQQGTQAILDKMCQMELDNLKAANEQLRQQLNLANLTASQTRQTAQLMQDNSEQTTQIMNRLSPNPVPAYPAPSPFGGAFTGNYM